MPKPGFPAHNPRHPARRAARAMKAYEAMLESEPSIAPQLARAFRLGIRFGVTTHIERTKRTDGLSTVLAGPVPPGFVPPAPGPEFAKVAKWEVSVDAVIWFPASWIEEGPTDPCAPDIWRSAIVYGRRICVKFWRPRPPSSERTKKIRSGTLQTVGQASLRFEGGNPPFHAFQMHGAETGRYRTDIPNVEEVEKKPLEKRRGYPAIYLSHELMRDAGYTLCMNPDHCGWHMANSNCFDDPATRNAEALERLRSGEFDQPK